MKDCLYDLSIAFAGGSYCKTHDCHPSHCQEKAKQCRGCADLFRKEEEILSEDGFCIHCVNEAEMTMYSAYLEEYSHEYHAKKGN